MTCRSCSPRSSGRGSCWSRRRSTSPTPRASPTSSGRRTRPSAGWSPGTPASATSSSTPPPAMARRRWPPPPRDEPTGSRVPPGMQVEVWSDVVCPWCYIGKRKLETALSRFAHADQVEVIWRSFQLDPSIPEGHTEATLPALAAKYGRSVEEMTQMQRRVEEVAAGEGLEDHLAEGVSGNTLLAHQLIHLAADRGLGGALKERLPGAHFEAHGSRFDAASIVWLD